MRARPVEMMRERPLGVRGRLVVEVWRPLRDLVVVRDLVTVGWGGEGPFCFACVEGGLIGHRVTGEAKVTVANYKNSWSGHA
jgi:hypothetical protein